MPQLFSALRVLGRPTNVFERAGESRMTPPASGILTTLSLVHRRLDNPIRTHVP